MLPGTRHSLHPGEELIPALPAAASTNLKSTMTSDSASATKVTCHDNSTVATGQLFQWPPPLLPQEPPDPHVGGFTRWSKTVLLMGKTNHSRFDMA